MSAEIRHILVPLDFSENAHRAMDVAAAMAQRFGAAVTLVHVVETMPYDIYLREGQVWVAPFAPTAKDFEKEWERYTESLQKRMNELAQSCGQSCQPVVREGDTVTEILRQIDESRPDIVVMCTHGWTGLRHAMLGSVTEKVVRRSPVPVLTVRAIEQAEAAA